MKKNQWPVRVASGCLMLLTLGGVALATSSQGTQDDPLVSVSYLSQVVTPSILNGVDDTLLSREAELVAQLEQVAANYSTEIERILDTANSESQSDSTGYVQVSLTAGQTLTGQAGTEILLRSGTATCVADSSPGFVDMTDSSSLANGATLVANHLYLAVVDGRGVQATTDVVLFVRGSYTVG